MWKRLAISVLVLGLVAVAFAGLGRTTPPSVETLTLERGELVAALALTGTLINDRTVTLTALLDGEITAIAVREGERAAAGQTLAALDDRQPRALLDQARAELTRERRRAATRRAAHERLEAMTANVSPQALEESRLELDSAEAAVEVAVARVRIAELALENATVRAPFAGTVTERDAEVGQWIEAGTRLFTLVADDGPVVEVQVDASDFERVREGQRATLVTEAAPERRWSSTVTWVAPAITADGDGTGDTFAIRLPIGEGAPAMLIGQRLDIDLEIDRREGVSVLPLDALRELAGGSATVLTIEDGVARERAVTLGLVTGEAAEIVAGLEQGETVIVPFGDTPEPGSPVSARAP